MASLEISKTARPTVLDLIESEIAPFDPLTDKTLIKLEVDRMTRCRHLAIRDFLNERSVGRRSVVKLTPTAANLVVECSPLRVR